MEDAVPQVELETEVHISIHSTAHTGMVLSSLEEQRKKNFLCDITLVVGNVQYQAHKALLAATSEYFSMMFADEGTIGQSVYVIEGIVAEVFEQLLQFIYTGNVHVNEKSLKQIVATAQVLKVDNLVKAYAEYLEHLKREAEAAEKEAAEEASKRKRGRPRKQCDLDNAQAEDKQPEKEPDPVEIPEIPATVEDTCYSNGNILHEHEVADFAAEVTCDLNPKPQEEQVILQRHSKRRSQRSIKLQDYRLGLDDEESAKHSVVKKQPSSEVCKDCGKVFKYKHFLITHRRVHTGERPFKCDQCGQGFAQKNSLRVHERMHTGERPYSCTVCSKSLSSKHSLMEHMHIHTDKKAFTCDRCDKIFTQRKQLKSHYRVHIGGGLQECLICQRKFVDTAQLKKHLRSHTGEKPFTCEICGKCFTAKSSLHTHMRIHRGEKPFSCSICGKAFADSSAQRRHIALHTGKKPFPCPNCEMQFTRLDNLRTHLKTHTNDKTAKSPTRIAKNRAKEEVLKSIKEEAKRRVQMQKSQAEAPNNQVQVMVSDNLQNLDYVPGHGQSVSIVTAEGPRALAEQAANVTLLTQQPHVLHGLPVASNQLQQIRNIDLIGSRVQTVIPEQMHVVTLSKEAFDQLKGQTHEIHLAQTSRPMPLTQVQAHLAQSVINQGFRIPRNAQQTLPVSAVTQPVPGQPIQAQPFQIQADAVSFSQTFNTTNSTSA